MRAKTGFGNMAGKGSAKRPYDVKKFDTNYLKRRSDIKTCASCKYLAVPMYGPIDRIKGRCVNKVVSVITNINTFRCTKWEAR